MSCTPLNRSWIITIHTNGVRVYVHSRVLHPQYRIPYLKLWSSLYVNRYRYDHVHDAYKAAEIEAFKLEELYKVKTIMCDRVQWVLSISCYISFVNFVKEMYNGRSVLT